MIQFQLRPDQLEDLGALMKNPRHALWSDPGTGKTPPAILYTYWLWQTLGHKTFWLQPLAIIEKNKDEFFNFSPFQKDDIKIFSGTPEAVQVMWLLEDAEAGALYTGKILGKENAAEKYYIAYPREKPKVTGSERIAKLVEKNFISIESSSGTIGKLEISARIRLTPLGTAYLGSQELQSQLRIPQKVLLMSADTFATNWEWLLTFNPEFKALIGDEWHKMFSTDGSQRTREMYEATTRLERVVPMTGTLIRGRLSSAYPAIRVLEPRYYPSYEAFMNYHAVLDDWGKPILWMREEKVREIMTRHGQRRSFESIFGKVPAIHQTHYVKMSGAQEEAYRKFEAEAILELEKVFLDGTLPGVNLIRSRQILSCPEIFGIGKGEQTARDAFVELQAADHLETGDPWMIGSACVPEQERICELLNKLGIKAEVMNGETSRSQRGALDRDFIARKIQALVVSFEVGSIGFNWSHVDHVTNLHQSYFHDDYEQFWKRTTRGVRTRPVLIDNIVYEDTVEEAVLGVIVKKMKLSNAVDPTKEVINLHGVNPRFDRFMNLA